MPNQITATNRVAQSFIENLPVEIADQLQGHTGVECFGCHFIYPTEMNRYYFTNDETPRAGDLTLTGCYVAEYDGDPRAKKIILCVEGVSHD